MTCVPNDWECLLTAFGVKFFLGAFLGAAGGFALTRKVHLSIFFGIVVGALFWLAVP